MPTPAELQRTQEQQQAARTLDLIASLKKCEGWKAWLGPKIFGAYDSAAERILAAHATHENPSPSDIATYQGLHDIVTAFRSTEKSAQAKLKP